MRVELPLAAELNLPKGAKKGNVPDGTFQEVPSPNTFMLL